MLYVHLPNVAKHSASVRSYAAMLPNPVHVQLGIVAGALAIPVGLLPAFAAFTVAVVLPRPLVNMAAVGVQTSPVRSGFGRNGSMLS